MISRTATKVGTEVIVERASFSVFHDQMLVTEKEVLHKLRFRFLSVVALALFCDYLLLTLCVPILPSLFGDNYSAIEIGLIFASKPFFQFLANPYMGEIVDKSGPKYPLLFGVIVLALSTFLFAYGLSFKNDLPTAYAMVMVARSVQGIASASTMSAGMTLSALTHHESNRGTAMGIAMIGVAFGTLSGPPIGGIMGYFLPLWSPYVLVGGLLICNALAQLYVLHRKDSTIPIYIKEADEPTRASRITRFSERTTEGPNILRNTDRTTDFDARQFTQHTERHTDLHTQHNGGHNGTSSPYPGQQPSGQPTSQYGGERHTHTGHNEHRPTEIRISSTIEDTISVITLLKQRKICFVVAVAVTGNCAIGMIEPLIPLYLHNTFNENILNQGLIFATATVAYLVFTPIAGMLSDSYPKWSCLSIGLACMAFGFGFLYVADSLVRVCVSLFFIGAGMSFIDTPALPLLSEIIEREELFAAGMVYALSDMALCVGFTVGPIAGPLLQEAFGGGTDGFQVAALIMGLLCACILPFPYIMLHDHHGVHSNKPAQSSDSGHKIEILSEVQNHHSTVNALHGQSSNAISVPLRKQQANGNVVISATNSSSLDSHASV